ncbi:MAG: adenylate kinase [Myxococcales bacterium]
MRLVLLGAPGSGKGTQAARLKEYLQVPHISTGDMLRAAVAAGTPIGLKAKAVMEAGQLVSDDILLGIIKERLSQDDVKNGFILDGYPRNVKQAEALTELLAEIGKPLEAVVKLDVPFEAIIARTEIRFKAEGRKDDNPEVVRDRLKVYAEQTAPVADFYAGKGQLQTVDGVGELDEVFGRIIKALDSSKPVG